MTVTSEMIALVSPFTVGNSDDDTFTETDFEYYKDRTKESTLDRDDPGLPVGTYDEAHANLICDMYMSSKGGRHMKSENIGGDYSYTKDGSGKSSYRLRYGEILKQWATEQPTAGQEREDVDYMPNQFKLDQQAVQKFEEQD